METLNASSASSKYTRMASIVILVHIVKVVYRTLILPLFFYFYHLLFQGQTDHISILNVLLPLCNSCCRWSFMLLTCLALIIFYLRAYRN